MIGFAFSAFRSRSTAFHILTIWRVVREHSKKTSMQITLFELAHGRAGDRKVSVASAIPLARSTGLQVFQYFNGNNFAK